MAAAEANSAADVSTRLEALAVLLHEDGWTARLVVPVGRMPLLFVQNPEPEAKALREYVYAQPQDSGEWFYWWSWAEPIAADASEAATIIARVLRSADRT